MIKNIIKCTVLAVVFGSATVYAHMGLEAPVPNGATFSCSMCHTGGPGSSMNCFGLQIKDTDWPAIYNEDADGDGFSNGQELGDPEGTWRDGDAHPDYPASMPYDANSTPCGNGLVEDGEICDQKDFGGLSCVTEGFAGGDLACVDQCARIDTSGCNLCGNEVIDDGEECDGANLDGASCQSLGFDQGTLGCNATSCLLDKSDCAAAGADCGNGLKEDGELCDGDDLAGASCQSLGFDEGQLACTAQTCQFDQAACSNNSSNDCGNGVKEDGEQCDGADLGDASCIALGYGGGSLSCDPATCRLDQSGCNDEVAQICGNGVRESNEECEVDDLDGQSCSSQGFGGGTLACVLCSFDISDCQAPGAGLITGGCASAARPGSAEPAAVIWALLLVLAMVQRRRLVSSRR